MGTLYDMLGSTIIGSLLILTALNLNASVVESTLNNTQNLIVQEESSLMDEILDRDLLNIGSGDTARSHILSATPASLVFRIDLDRNGRTDTVAYYYTIGSKVEEILGKWGYPAKSLPVDKFDSVIFRLSTISEGDPVGSPKLVTSRARRFLFSYFDGRRVSLGLNPPVTDSIRYVSVSMLLIDGVNGSGTNRAQVDWQKTYRPKNL